MSRAAHSRSRPAEFAGSGAARIGLLAVALWLAISAQPVPAAEISVRTVADSGPGSLREAILVANSNGEASNTIVFAISQNNAIFLQSALPLVQGDLVLDATQNVDLRITKSDANATFSILEIAPQGRIELVDLRIDSGDFVIGTDGELGFRNETALDAPDPITGAGRLVKDGSARLRLSGVNTYSGGTHVKAGILAGNTQSLQGDFQLDRDGELAFELATSSPSVVQSFAGDVSGEGRMRKSGGDDLRLTGLVAHTGGTFVDAGRLIATSANLSGDVVVASGARLRLGEAASSSYAGNLSGGGGVEKTGAGRLTLAGANSFTGRLSVLEGTLVGTTSSVPGNVQLDFGTVLELDQAGDGVHAGTISGAGRLVKLGTGVVHLTRPATHTGGTRIGGPGVAGGTLRGDTRNLQGDIELYAGSILDFAQGFDDVFNGRIGLDGTVVKSGAATLTFAFDQSYAGPTRVTAGTLRLDSALRGLGPLEVEPGGRLTGTGRAAGLLVARGAVTPGPGVGATLAVGSARFEPGSQLGVSIDAVGAGTNSSLQVSGPADLAGGTVDVSLAPGDYSAGRSYTILDAASLTGQFTGTAPVYAFVDLSLTHDAAAGDVRLGVQPNQSSTAQWAQTSNQRSTAIALDEMRANGSPDVGVLLQSLYAMRADQLPSLLDALAGDTLGAMTNARLANAERFERALSSRYTATRFERPDRGYLPERRERVKRPAPVDAAGPLPFALSRGEHGLGTWLDAFGSFGELDGRDRANDIVLRQGGATLGLDYRLPDSLGLQLSALRIGAAYGYTRHSLRTPDESTLGSGNTHQLGGYAAFQQPLFHVGAAGRWATSDMRSERRVVFGDIDRRAQADFGGDEVGASVEAGLHLGDPGVLLVEPLAGFQFARLEQEGFQEAGAGALDLEVAPMTADALLTRLGVGFSRMLPLRGRFGIQPELRLGWSHDSGDRGRHVEARFSGALDGGGRFVVAGAERNRDAFHLEAGYVMRVADVPLLSLRYGLRLGEDESRHDLTAALLLHW